MKRIAIEIGLGVNAVRRHLEAGRTNLLRADAGEKVRPDAELVRRCGRCGFAIAGTLEAKAE